MRFLFKCCFPSHREEAISFREYYETNFLPLTSPSRNAVFKWLAFHQREDLKKKSSVFRGKPEFFECILFREGHRNDAYMRVDNVQYHFVMKDNVTEIKKVTDIHPNPAIRNTVKMVESQVPIEEIIKQFVNLVLNRRGTLVRYFVCEYPHDIFIHLNAVRLTVWSLQMCFDAEKDIANLKNFRNLQFLKLGRECSRDNYNDLMQLDKSIDLEFHLNPYPTLEIPPHARLHVVETQTTFAHFVECLRKFYNTVKVPSSSYKVFRFSDVLVTSKEEMFNAISAEFPEFTRSARHLSISIDNHCQLEVRPEKNWGRVYGAVARIQYIPIQA